MTALLFTCFSNKAEVEVERLDQLKASRMKEIAFKRQAELEEIYAHAHVEIDTEAARGKIMELIDSGSVEPSELLADMDNQIVKAKEEALSRKDILDKVEKWMSACEEESWLEDYMRVYAHTIFQRFNILKYNIFDTIILHVILAIAVVFCYIC